MLCGMKTHHDIVDGTLVIGTVKAGSKIIDYKGKVVILHPDDAPRYINNETMRIEEMPVEWRENFDAYVFCAGQQWTPEQIADATRT